MRVRFLKDVCLDFIVPQRDKPKVFDGNIPWCRIEDIEGRYLNGSKSGRMVSKELADKMNMHLCPKGSVICACSASIGNQAITTIDCYTNQTFIGIVPNPELLNNVYLYYFFVAQAEVLKGMGQGATIKYISQDKFKSMPIPVPSLPEQQRIVDILDQEFAKIDALKANAEKSLQAAKDLFQATLKKELEPKDGWETKQITEIASLKAGKFVSAQDIYDECGEEMYPCYGGNGLRGYVKTYNHEGRYNLIGRQGALCGNINIAEGKFHATEHAVVVSPIIPVVFKFLYFSLCNANINQYATGAAQPGISVKNINERLFLGFPSLAEQAKVADRIDQIKQQTESLQENYQKTLTLCDDLKQALLRKAFNGEL